MTTFLIIVTVLVSAYVVVREIRARRDDIREQIATVHLQIINQQQGYAMDLRAMHVDIQERFTQLLNEAVVRITDIEARPAEVVTVEVPTVSPAVVARGMQSAGPSQRDDVTIRLMDPNECHEEGRAVVPRRKRSPTMRQGGSTYAQSRELNGEWVYRRVGGR